MTGVQSTAYKIAENSMINGIFTEANIYNKTRNFIS